MNKFILILVIAVSLQTFHCFQLQGAWSLTEIRTYPTLYEPVIVQISDTIHRQTTILQNIIFSGCQSYKYLLESNQNNLFIGYSSIQYEKKIQSYGNRTLRCSDDTAKMHSIIRSKLIQVFYFEIAGNFLVFLNPNRQILLKFKRIQSNRPKILRGIWNLYNFRSNQVSQTVQITDSQITLCQGRLNVGYILTQKYGFRTRLISNDGCNVTDLERTVLSSSFSRRVGGTLEIYDSNLDVIMLLDYVNELDLLTAQQNRQKAIQEARLNEQRAAQARAQAESIARVQAQAQAKAQAQSLTTSLNLNNTKQDLLGLWQPIRIMGMIIGQSPVYFIFSSNSISYNGGCNAMQFQYTVTESSRSILVGQNRSTSNNCQVNDDGLYVNGMVRVRTYAVSIVGREFRLRLNDGVGNSVYQFKKTVQVASNTSAPTVSTVSTAPTAITNSSPILNSFSNVHPSQSTNTATLAANTSRLVGSLGLEPGRYIFLVLARRDLPRRFCTITGSKITYTACNTIEHSFTVTAKGQIRISAGAVSGMNNCSANNDQVIMNAFNSISSFAPGIQTGSYVLSNARNQNIINLSLL